MSSSFSITKINSKIADLKGVSHFLSKLGNKIYFTNTILKTVKILSKKTVMVLFFFLIALIKLKKISLLLRVLL